MNNEEWFGLYRFARRTANETGLSEIERDYMRERVNSNDGKDFLVSYLEDISNAIRSRSRGFPEEIVSTINENLEGGKVADLAVEIAGEEDRLRYETEEIVLVGSSDFDDILNDFQALIDDIRNE